MNYTYKKDGYRPDNEVFVFGSNMSGIHGAGAAKEAFRNYGAAWGIGYGMEGHSFAIPTKDRDIQTLPIEDIKVLVNRFKKFAEKNQHIKFYVSRIGCGLAGYKDADMAPLFIGSPSNCSFAEEWEKYLED